MNGVEETVDDHLVDVIDVSFPDFRIFSRGKILTIGVQKPRNRLALIFDIVISTRVRAIVRAIVRVRECKCVCVRACV